MNSAARAPARGGAPRLYIITDRTVTGGRPLEAVMAAALEGARRAGVPVGAIAVQLREKDLTTRELVVIARALRALTAAAGARLYVNDRVDVALAVGADGVHLSAATGLSPPEVARIDPALSIAISTHRPEEIAAAGAERIEFAVLGPIKDTPSKRRYGPPLGWDRLAAASRLGVPLVAIGGLAPDDVPIALQNGAVGVACIRAVLGADDPAAAVIAFCKQLSAPTQTPRSKHPQQT